ncbi:hypothetical protein [Streptomyces ochraceiscleroticus]|uniref:Uncharacterized protein n=1 Tax=Streptomyces ochraceiscleroticus TaxID=47761 RepID=A0ABW1MQK5_9ACTN|nr:hypothetical protein [Streptomyces ochraceiscleroticus]
MPWTFDKSRMEVNGQLTASEQEKFDIFQNAIQSEGLHPAQAAARAGDTNYKRLQGDQFQIRLSQGSRATFLVLDAGGGNGTVEMLQLAGHT